MTTPPIAPPTLPNLRTLLDSTQQQTMAQMNCHQVGQVVSFDATKQTASVQLQMLAVLPDGSQVPYPVLTDCPVFIYGGGGAVITLPVAAGDPCLVLFNDRDLDNWFTTGNVVVPNSPRTHSLSDGLVLVGFRSLSAPIASYSTTDVEIRFGAAKVVLAATGAISLLGSAGTVVVRANGSIFFQGVSGTFLELTTGGKLELFVGSTTLGVVMDNLMAALAAWVNTGGTTPNATTLTSLAAVKTQLDGMLA